MPRPSRFISLLYDIVNNSQQDSPITWSDQGKAFVILRISEAQIILKDSFNISKFESFLRQLGLYGFKMRKNIKNQKEYYNQYFVKGGYQNLWKIERKQQKPSSENINNNNLLAQNKILQKQLIILKNTQSLLSNKIKISFQIQCHIAKILNNLVEYYENYHSQEYQEKKNEFKKYFWTVIFGFHPDNANNIVKQIKEIIDEECLEYIQMIGSSQFIYSPFLFKL